MKAAALALFFTLSALSQSTTTWAGLRFGMKPAEVRKHLGERVQLGLMERGEETMNVAGIKVGESIGSAHLRFSSTDNTLKGISLRFEPMKGNCQDEAIGTKRYSAFLDVSDALVRKYGPPTENTGWPSSDKFLRESSEKFVGPNSTRKWVLQDQTIISSVSVGCELFMLTVSYLPPVISPDI